MRDSLENATAAGSLGDIISRLGEILRDDYAANSEEIGEFCEFEFAVAESQLQPDALHVLTRIWAKDGQGGEINYGARVQRVDRETFVLWADY